MNINHNNNHYSCNNINNNNKWRRQTHQHHQELPAARSRHRKPPCHGNWQPTVPSWEKRFCYSVGSIPWRKLVEAKKFMYLYQNIVQWNDSAGEEAFYNAKSRFWAEINGLPCNIGLPDPDVYIDEIDWNSKVDPELLLDLEREPMDPDERNKGEEVVILDKSLLLNQSFSCTGWGETDEAFQKVPSSALDHGPGECGQNVCKIENPWESNVTQINRASKADGWGNSWNDPCGWANSYNGWDNNYKEGNNEGVRIVGDEGAWDGKNQSGEEPDHWHMSRYKTSRFLGNGYQMDRGWWRNGRGRRNVNLVW